MSTVCESGDSSACLKLQELVRGWLSETGATRVDIEYIAVALTSTYVCWIEVDGEWSRSHLPSEISFAMNDLRAAQADPRRGAWLCSHLWVEAADGVLHQESDWMREPVISARPIGGADAVAELEYYPRDPEWIPEWMATKAAAFHKQEEARARRRERDRARRERKKAEAAQATQETATHTANTNEDVQ